jgi:sugar phosphate isomerase/epimerase
MWLTGAKIDEIRVDGNLSALRNDLGLFAGMQLKAVELPVHGLDAIRNGKLDKKRIREIKHLLGDFDFTYSIHAPNPMNLMDKEHGALHASVFRSSAEFAGEIGSKVLVCHPGRFIPEEMFPLGLQVDMRDDEKEELLDHEVFIIEKISSEFPDIIICMENARPYLFHSPYCYAERIDLLRNQVLKISRQNVRINLDLGHLYMASRFYGFDSVREASGIKDLIGHTHIHDNFGLANYHHEKLQTHLLPFGKGDAHMPVGWGEIPIAGILSTFLDLYKGMLMMELRSRYIENILESKKNLEKILTDYEQSH